MIILKLLKNSPQGDSIIWITYSEMPIIDTCNSVQELADEEYFFPVGNHYKFEWSDKENILPSGQYIMEMKEFYRIVSI